jgi:hypothetical protein
MRHKKFTTLFIIVFVIISANLFIASEIDSAKAMPIADEPFPPQIQVVMILSIPASLAARRLTLQTLTPGLPLCSLMGAYVEVR